MYKKSLGVKVLSAIMTGALLAGNVTPALAQEKPAQVSDKDTDGKKASPSDAEKAEDVVKTAPKKAARKAAEQSENVTMNIQFKDGDEVVAGGDYTVPAGVQSYSVLEQYVPEGYEMTTSGDFYAEDGAKLVVNIQKMATINIQFKDGDKVVAGGDYTVPAGTQNYSVLEEYVPEGYEMTTSGDFYAEDGGKLVVNVEKVTTDVTMNIQFKDGDEVVAGGDYTVPGGVQNYSVLEQYVPEGYEMTTSGDFYAEDGGKLVINVEKVTTDVTMNIQFKDGDEVVAGGDYTVPGGVQNYSVLEQYVPEGYKITTSGDFYAEDGGKLVVNIEKIVADVTMNIQFKAGEEVVAGGDYTVPAGVQNYSVLQQYVPEGYKMTVSGDFYAEADGKLVVGIEKISTDVTMNIQFKAGDEVVAGGDYTVPAGVQNYSVLEQYVPVGYQMTVSGDFMAEDGGQLVVNIEKIANTVTMNIQFKAGEEVVAGGDYTVPAGVQNYSVLQKYVPEGYQMTVSGDFYAEDGAHLEVNIEKIAADVTMNIQFKDGDEVVAGGDYFVPAGVQNYSVLEQYVPEGYKMTVSGDFYAEAGGSLVVSIEKITTDIIMNIQFKDGDEVVAGGDYTVPAGVQNYSVLEQYVPEGYQMTVSGDFFAEAGGSLVVSIEKITTDIIMNIQFKDGDEVVAGGDYFVPAGVQNYSVLEKYVPAGYKMTVSGDFFAEAGAKLEVSIEPIETEVIMNIQFKTADGEVVAGGDYFVPAGVQNYLVLEQYLPEGYQFSETGDFMAEEGGHLEVKIEKITTEVIMNIQFKDGDEVVAGGDYFVPAGVQNYSVLEQYVPEGYKMTVSGDFMATEGAHLDVSIELIEAETEDIIMNIQFKTAEGIVIAGGDYFVPEGVQNYSVLEKYVPAGWKMAVSGDFFAEAGAHLEVRVEKEGTETQEMITKVQFVYGYGDDKEVIAGGDYFVAANEYGIYNLSELEEYVPEGYVLAESGDAFVDQETAREVRVEKKASETQEMITKVQFVYNGEVVAGGDYFVAANEYGIYNLSELEEYVPEGYVLAESGDAFVDQETAREVRVEKKASETQEMITKVQFVYNGEVVAGGDYFVAANEYGIYNLSELEEYVPEGYVLAESGDAFVDQETAREVRIEKIAETKDVAVTYIDEETNAPVGTENITVDADAYNVNTSVLTRVPEGYELVWVGDIVLEGSELSVLVRKTAEEPTDPSEETKTIVVNYYDDDGGALLGQETVVVDADAQTINVGDLKKIPEGYEAVLDEWTISGPELSVIVRKIAEEPTDPSQETKEVTVIYYDENGNLVAEDVIKVPADATTVDTSTLTNIPGGYEIANGGVVTIVDGTISVTLKAFATATLTIHYNNAGTEVGSQTITAKGTPGADHVFNLTDDVLAVPEGYHYIGGDIDPVTVVYGQAADVTINVVRYTQGNGGSGGGGSSSGGSSVSSATALISGDWVLDNVGWWYRYSNSTYAVGGWYYLEWQGNMDWYYFDSTGYLVSGWFDNNGMRYYLHDVHDGTFGRMYIGWNNIGGQWYYFSESTTDGTLGALVADAQVPAELLNQ